MIGLLITLVLISVIGPGTAAVAGPASLVRTDQQRQQADTGFWTADATLLLVLSQDQYAGRWKQFTGDLKQIWGHVTDDDLLYIAGGNERYESKLQERDGDREVEVKQWSNSRFHHHPFGQQPQYRRTAP
jgi:uncharacterized protein YjbJ (UPF0337 family)